MLPDGWHFNIPMADYLADPALNATGLGNFGRSPLHYQHTRNNPKDATPAMIEGTALHYAVLEPALFADRYIVLGQCDATKKGDGKRCTNTGVVYRRGNTYCGVRGHDPQAGEPMRDGIDVLSEEAMARLLNAQAAVANHAVARKFFDGQGWSEVTGIWTDLASGVRCKIRVDREIERAALHTDLKYTADASPDFFQRQAANMGWVKRSAWYRRGMEALGTPADGSVIIAVESQGAQDCAVYLFDEGDIAAFGDSISARLDEFAECEASGVWPGYPQELTRMKLKPWALPYEEPTNNFED